MFSEKNRKMALVMAMAGNYQEAVKYMQKAAESNHPDAQYHLGVWYLIGQGVNIDAKKGYELIESAARQDHCEALVLMGDVYYFGDENGYYTANPKKAFGYYSKAANRYGADKAKLMVGKCYTLGHGVQQDFKEGYWNLMGLAGDDEDADPDEIEDKIDMIREAQYLIGKCEYGMKHYELALEWWRKAAKNGSAEAKKILKDINI